MHLNDALMSQRGCIEVVGQNKTFSQHCDNWQGSKAQRWDATSSSKQVPSPAGVFLVIFSKNYPHIISLFWVSVQCTQYNSQHSVSNVHGVIHLNYSVANNRLFSIQNQYIFIFDHHFSTEYMKTVIWFAIIKIAACDMFYE